MALFFSASAVRKLPPCPPPYSPKKRMVPGLPKFRIMTLILSFMKIHLLPLVDSGIIQSPPQGSICLVLLGLNSGIRIQGGPRCSRLFEVTKDGGGSANHRRRRRFRPAGCDGCESCKPSRYLGMHSHSPPSSDLRAVTIISLTMPGRLPPPCDVQNQQSRTRESAKIS